MVLVRYTLRQPTFTPAFAARHLSYDCGVQIQDKVAFVMNNLAEENMTDKAEEARKLITQEHWPWFVNYLVVRRAAQVRLLAGWRPSTGLFSSTSCRAE